MAVIYYQPDENGDVAKEIVSTDLAFDIWQMLHGIKQPETDKQTRRLESMEFIHLNWRTAPDEYVQHYQENIMEMAVRQWQRDAKGVFTRPDFGDQHGWEFGKKWGLLQNGISTTRARAISNRLNQKFRRSS